MSTALMRLGPSATNKAARRRPFHQATNLPPIASLCGGCGSQSDVQLCIQRHASNTMHCGRTAMSGSEGQSERGKLTGLGYSARLILVASRLAGKTERIFDMTAAQVIGHVVPGYFAFLADAKCHDSLCKKQGIACRC